MNSSDLSDNEPSAGIDKDLYTISSDHVRLGREYDEAARDLLKHKEILAYILHRYVSEFLNLTYEETFDWLVSLDQGRCSLVESLATDFKGIVFDIFFSVMTMIDGLIYVNIEIQHQSTGYPLIYRALFYIGYMIVRQYRAIRGFSYEKLCRCYSIWLIVDCYKLQSDKIYQEENDLSSVILIYLSPKNDNFLYTLLSTTISYREKVEAFKKEHIYYSENILEEVKTMCNLGEHIFYQGFDEGFGKGHNEGFDEGQASMLLELLSNKFGTISNRLFEEIHDCSEAQLKMIAAIIFDINSEVDIENILK